MRTCMAYLSSSASVTPAADIAVGRPGTSAFAVPQRLRRFGGAFGSEADV